MERIHVAALLIGCASNVASTAAALAVTFQSLQDHECTESAVLAMLVKPCNMVYLYDAWPTPWITLSP